MIYTVTLNPTLDRTLTVPNIIFDEVLRAGPPQLDIGGKGFNVSRALIALGCPNTAMGFLGGGTGAFLESGLQALQILCDFVRIKGESRTNVVVIEESTQRYIKANEPGPYISADEGQAFLDRVAHLAVENDIWVFSGSYPPGIAVDFYARIIDLVQSKGSLAVLDTSGEMLRTGIKAHPYLIKPNSLEAEQGSGIPVRTPDDAARAACFFLDQGVKLAAISMGKDGLVLSSREQALHVQPPEVQARNPTAAGDALLAGLVWALQQRLPMADVARWGVAAGTAAAMQDGSGVGSKKLVQELYEQITTVRNLSIEVG
jgi:1-phosphofructokinase family hexose kinase